MKYKLQRGKMQEFFLKSCTFFKKKSFFCQKKAILPIFEPSVSQ